MTLLYHTKVKAKGTNHWDLGVAGKTAGKYAGKTTFDRPTALAVEKSMLKKGGSAYLVNAGSTPPTPFERIDARGKKDLGQTEHPAGSNSGPFVTPVLKRCGCPDHNPWCCAWATGVVADCAHDDARIIAPLLTAGCGTLRAWAQHHGLWVAEPQPGYIGIVRPDEHAVIVQHVDHLGVHDISGNTSATNGHDYNGGTVAEHVHDLSIFSGFVKTIK